MDGAVWLLKEDALRLGAGFLPVYNDRTMAHELLAPNEQAELNLRTLFGAFNDTRDWLKITRPMTFERDGYRYVEARGFLDWLSQYICQTQAKEFTFPGELAHDQESHGHGGGIGTRSRRGVCKSSPRP